MRRGRSSLSPLHSIILVLLLIIRLHMAGWVLLQALRLRMMLLLILVCANS